MLRGIYNCSAGSARELGAASRLTGPDMEVLARGPLAVAWRRDSSVGCVEVEGITCVLDGYLYEPAELTRELGIGAVSDADLVAHAYRRHGEDALEKLRGRFSVVLWDHARGEGLIATDLLAVQPVFLHRGVGWLGFASELGDLLRILPSTPGPDPLSFVKWLGGGGEPLPGTTLFEGVTRIGPGELVGLESGAVKTRHYWQPRYRGINRATRAEHAEGLREQLERSVRRRVSPRSSGVVLSGGVDSAIVTGFASRVEHGDARLRTYSAAFPDYPELDESWKVRSLSAALEIDATAFEVQPQGAFRLALEHARRWHLPLQGVAALIDVSMVAAAAEAGAEVVLDGQTGDEVLGFAPYLVSDRLRQGRMLAALKLARGWPIGRPTTRRDQRLILKNIGLRGAVPYRLWRLAHQRPQSARRGPEWLLPAVRSQAVDLSDRWAWKGTGSGPLWWRYLSDKFIQWPHRHLRLDYLRHRAAAVGVTNESPLYDFDVIDYCLRLPPEIAFDSKLNRPLAREAVADIIPDDVRLQTDKSNLSRFCFDVLTGPDAPGIERLLTSPDAEIGAYVDLEWVKRLWGNRPEPGTTSTMAWGTQVWHLVSAESWLRAQAAPDAVDELLARADVPRPARRPTVHGHNGTFSRLAGSERRVYG